MFKLLNSAEYDIKNSKFLGLYFEAFSEKDVKDAVNEIKNNHKKANHVCYAYRICGENFLCRACDDKEPSGTAGKPILNVIEKQGKENCLIIVVRYFGGIKLGAGGLVRAYTKTASLALGGRDAN